MTDLVPTHEACEALKATGFPQDTVHSWYDAPMFHTHLDGGLNRQCVVKSFAAHDHRFLCAAPTLEEILRVLPEKIRNGKRGYGNKSLLLRGGQIGYAPRSAYHLTISESFPSDASGVTAQAAADLYLALHRAGHIQEVAQ